MIAFQIAWKLFHSRWNLSCEPTRRPRILFLADRNILANQAYNAFSPFPEDALVRIAPDDIKKKGRVPKNGSIFFTIFQTFMSGPPKEGKPSPYFGEYPPDFFDFMSSTNAIAAVRTTKVTGAVSWNIFGSRSVRPHRDSEAEGQRRYLQVFRRPVYVYSLREGINDGFLTPFKVKQIATTLDDYVYTSDDDVIAGEVEAGKRYVEADFNKIIAIKAREKKRVRIFMDEINQQEKTLVFCATQDHALAVRDLINQMKTASKDPNYCARVTANDGERGNQFLRDFQDTKRRFQRF